MIKTTTIDDPKEVLGLMEDWQRIYDNFYDNPFLSPQWHRTWLKTHKPKNLHLLLFTSSSRVVGLLPLYHHYSILYFFSAGDHYALCPEYIDVIYEPEYAEQINAELLKHLRSKRFQFGMVKSDSLFSRTLTELGHNPSTLQSYQITNLEICKKNFRRVLKQQADYHHRIVRGEEQIQIIPDLIALHEGRFQNRSTIFKNPCNIDLIKKLISGNQTVISILSGQEQPVAIFLYLVSKRELLFYLSGVSLQTSIKSPGILNHILTASILDLPVDLLAGEEKYKERLASASLLLHNYASLGMFHKSVTIIKRSVSRLLKCKGSLLKS